MAQFDFYPMQDGPGYWLDCQTEFMSHFDTRLVIPLMPLPHAPAPAAHLNPLFDIEGKRHSLVTQFAGSIPASQLRHASGSLAGDSYTIMNAIDFLLTGV